jgi:hypothetical protein
VEKQRYISAITRLLRKVALVELIILVAVGAVCWFGGWRMLSDFAGGLSWAGVLVLVFGCFSLMGGMKASGDFSYQQAQSVMSSSLHERTRQNMRDLEITNSFMSILGIAGLVAIALGQLIKVVLT